MKKVMILIVGVLTAIVLSVKADAAFYFYNGVWYIDMVDYRSEMYKCAKLGDENSMCLGSIYEKQRNAKLCFLGYQEAQTTFFSPEKSGNDVCAEMIGEKMREEYSVAGYVYERLRKASLSDVAIAGILGSMMNECGGNTLHLNPDIYEYEYRKHYGLCQWSVLYSPEMNGASLEDQVTYLIETMGKNMHQFGGSLEEFNQLKKPEDAGAYFCKYYERGINSNQRSTNSATALEWIMKFTKEDDENV